MRFLPLPQSLGIMIFHIPVHKFPSAAGNSVYMYSAPPIVCTTLPRKSLATQICSACRTFCLQIYFSPKVTAICAEQMMVGYQPPFHYIAHRHTAAKSSVGTAVHPVAEQNHIISQHRQLLRNIPKSIRKKSCHHFFLLFE